MTGDDPRDLVRALIPGLRYLAAEALRSGIPVASVFIVQAIAKIETAFLEGDEHGTETFARAGGAVRAGR